mmetsp:Transcript_17845/g.53857  ORF Transcript_17845/g.53857 Transcript_17845/m.53857 type:complete len:111 (-) Transcript_17845:68-400(-)
MLLDGKLDAIQAPLRRPGAVVAGLPRAPSRINASWRQPAAPLVAPGDSTPMRSLASQTLRAIRSVAHAITKAPCRRSYSELSLLQASDFSSLLCEDCYIDCLLLTCGACE